MTKESSQKGTYPPRSRGIKNWPEDERPRERLLRQGEHNLSNTELLAILLRTGIRGESAIDLARKIIAKFPPLWKWLLSWKRKEFVTLIGDIIKKENPERHLFFDEVKGF